MSHPRVKAFLDAFASGPVHDADEARRLSEGLVGRIFRYQGHKDVAPETTTPPAGATLARACDRDDPDNIVLKPFVFAVGGDGLAYALQMGPKGTLRTLQCFGIDRSFIEIEVNIKHSVFCLIVIPETKVGSNALPVLQATWDGVFQFIKHCDPPLAPHVDVFGPVCVAKAHGFIQHPDFEKHYTSVDFMDRTDVDVHKEHFLTPRRYINRWLRGPNAVSWLDFRVLLWKWYGLNPHFEGDGYTLPTGATQETTSDSASDLASPTRLKEYLMPNTTLEALTDPEGPYQGALMPLRIYF